MTRRARFGLVAVLLIGTGLCAGAVQSSAQNSAVKAPSGGIVRIALAKVDFDYIDPALSLSVPVWALLDTTCARLLTYPDKAPPAASRLLPEVATGPPLVSRDAKTWTFTIRSGFRFSDGTTVRATAFARAINRTLAP